MTVETGIVERILTKDFKGTMLYSFSCGEKGPLFGMGSHQPKFKEGDKIEFSYELNKKGYPLVDSNSVKVVEQGAVQPVTRKPPSNGAGAGGREEYWQHREARDEATQKRISYQAAKNTATAIFSKAVELGLVSLGTKKDEKLDNFLRGINDLTLDTYWEYQDVPTLSRPSKKAVKEVKGNVEIDVEEDVPY